MLDVTATADQLRTSIDVALAVLAYAQHEQDIGYVRERAKLTTAKWRKPYVILDHQEFAQKLKTVFNTIAENHNLGVRGRRKRFSRRKVTVAIGIILDAFNSRASR